MNTSTCTSPVVAELLESTHGLRMAGATEEKAEEQVASIHMAKEGTSTKGTALVI